MAQNDQRKRPYSWGRLGRDLVLLALVLAAIHWWQTREALSGPAPALTGQLLDGRLVALTDFRGHPVLVHFWATWCPICRLEQATIDALARDYAVVTVATTSGSAGELQGYLQEHGLEFPVLLDEAGELARRWGIQGVPTSFVVDPDGQIAHVSVGYTTGVGLRIRLWLAAR